MTQVNQTRSTSVTVTPVYEFVLTLWDGILEEIYEDDGTCHPVVSNTHTVVATFSHPPTKKDWDSWLSNWKGVGLKVLSSPQPFYRYNDEF